jgi:hypothetical protein
VDDAGLTETAATVGADATTVTLAAPDTAPDDAVIVAAPTAIAVTKPFADTVATPEFDVDQVTATPLSMLAPSSAVADNCACWPV